MKPEISKGSPRFRMKEVVSPTIFDPGKNCWHWLCRSYPYQYNKFFVLFDRLAMVQTNVWQVYHCI